MEAEIQRPKSIVLLSGGLDSSVNLLMAVKETMVVGVLTFDYGQRAAKAEIRAAIAQCESLGLAHHVIELPWLKAITKTSLVNVEVCVPQNVEIDDREACEQSALRVWVPNRNGVFLNIAASFAEALGANVVIPGFNAEEAVTFPDNSEDFLDAATNALSYSTLSQVEVRCFTTDMNKTEIARKGRALGLNLEHVWSCYFDGNEICGTCESCLRFRRATGVTRSDLAVEGL